MPLVPSRDPSPARFPPLPPLAALPNTQPLNGVAPWAASTQHKHSHRRRLPFSAMSPLVFGGGAFGEGMYNSDELIASAEPLKAIRLAFRYGINAIDTSPYYHPSEFILGRVLRALRPEFPREHYFLLTKCGRYGPERAHFDYSPARVRRSILHSCHVLGTDYLDVAFMHDVEFVAEHVGTSHHSGDDAARAPSDPAVRARLGIDDASAAVVRGPGDLAVLGALSELFKLKDEGRIRAVGISGYPLPVLLRIARLAATAPEGPQRPLDAILSYSNHTLHSDILPEYIAMFADQPAGTVFRRPGRRRESPAAAAAPHAPADPLVVDAQSTTLHVPSLANAALELEKDPPFLSLPETQHLFARRASFIGRNVFSDAGSDAGSSSTDARPGGGPSTPGLSSSRTSPADSPALSPSDGRSPLFAALNVPSPQYNASGSEREIHWHPPLVLNGSPFSMGLLTTRGPPTWHPAKPELRQACEDAARELRSRNQELVDELDGMREARRRSRNASHASLSSLGGTTIAGGAAGTGPGGRPALASRSVSLGLAQIEEEEAEWRRAEARTDIEASVLLPADRFARAALAYGLRGAEIASRANRCWADATSSADDDLFEYDRPEPLLRTLTGLSTEAQVNDAIETFRILAAGRRAYPTATAAPQSTSVAPDLFAVPDVLQFGMHAKTLVAHLQEKLEAFALDTEGGSEGGRAALAEREGQGQAKEDGEAAAAGTSPNNHAPHPPSTAVSRAPPAENDQQRYLRAFAQHCADEKLVLELMRERQVRRWSWASPPE